MKGYYLDSMTKTSNFEEDMFVEIVGEQDVVEKARYLEKARAKARELGRFKEFENLLKAYAQQHAQSVKNLNSHVTCFTDAPLVLNCGKYIADDTGVSVSDITRAGDVVTSVACPHPILVTERLVNIDAGTERARVAFFRDGQWRSMLVGVGTIFNKAKLTELADQGVIVTSESAKDLVKYFAIIMDQNEREIPRYRSISRLGWLNDGFAPYVAEVKFDGEDDFSGIYKCLAPHGDKKIWTDHMYEIRKNMEVRLVMAASFASPMIKKVGALPFVLHLWGKTGGGKTVALMARHQFGVIRTMESWYGP